MKKIICLVLSLLMILSMFTTVYGYKIDYKLSINSFDKIVGSDETGEMFCVRNNEKYGYVDKNGKVILDFIYDYAREFSCGLAYVEKDDKYAFIDKKGNIKIDLKLSNFSDSGVNFYGADEDTYLSGDKFYNGYAIVGYNRCDIIIDTNGNIVEHPSELTFQSFDIVDDMAVVGRKNSMSYGYLNLKTMKYIIDYFPVTEFENGIGIATGFDGSVNIVDKDLNVATMSLCVDDYSSADLTDKYISITTYDDNFTAAACSLYDLSGNQIFSSDKYQYLGEYSDGLISFIQKNNSGLYGYMDIKGNVNIQPKFKFADKFNNGLAVVSENYDKETEMGKFGVIDKQGNYIIKPTYDNIVVDKASKVIYAQIQSKWSIISILPDEPDTWAKNEVQLAIDNKLIPDELQCNYKDNITREDFCKLTISLVESKLNKSIDEVLVERQLTTDENPFTDTTSKTVIAANKLGIVNGKGNGIFEPNGFITRQEAAVMLTNVAKVLNVDVTAKDSNFTDNNKIASWAKLSVNYVADKQIMKGTENGFEPTSTYTRQQAYLTILRLYNTIV